MRGFLSVAALVLVGLSGCTKSEKVPGSGGVVVQITQGTVGVVEGLRIGVSNVIEVEGAAGSGEKSGLMVVLTLFIDGNPPQGKTVRLRAGQRAALGGFSVYVEEIRGDPKARVTLRVG